MRALTLLLIATPALAHEGHGAPSAHLHGWDGTGLMALAAAAGVAAVWWFTKGRK
jgi:hypothetical protein